MPTGVTYITEEYALHISQRNMFCFKGTLTYLALGILGGVAAMGVGEGWYGARDN